MIYFIDCYIDQRDPYYVCSKTHADSATKKIEGGPYPSKACAERMLREFENGGKFEVLTFGRSYATSSIEIHNENNPRDFGEGLPYVTFRPIGSINTIDLVGSFSIIRTKK